MNKYTQTQVSQTTSSKIPIDLNNQVIDLREKNIVLAQKVQYWRSVAAQKDREKLDCMKEINELRIQISKYRKNGLGLEKKFESAVNDLGASSLTRLVEVSGFIAQIINLTDIHKKEREDLQNDQLSTKVKKSVNKIRRVEPMIGGLSIKPFVALRRAVINSTPVAVPTADEPILSDESNNEEIESEPSDNLPLLQELYVPLHRIDVNPSRSVSNSLNVARSVLLPPSNVEYEEDLSLDLEQIEEEITERNRRQDDRSNDLSDDVALYELHRVEELPEDEDSHLRIDSNIPNWNPQVLLERSLNNAAINNATPRISQTEIDPLEGPSWLLDLTNSVRSSNSPTFNSGTNIISNFLNPERCELMQIPDSTTNVKDGNASVLLSSGFSREQERKKCRLFSVTNNLENTMLADSDSDSDDNWKPSRKKRLSKKKRKMELKDPRSVKVLISKINEKHVNAALSPRAMKKRKGASEQTERTPKRTARPNLDTPSPNGSTVPQMFISEDTIHFLPQLSGGDTTEDDSQRQRRPRSTPASYKEKPLNRKLRRS